MANKIVKHCMDAVSYDTGGGLITDVDKTKAISELSWKELQQLIGRLNLEREAENLIRDLRRNSGEQWDYENPPKIDTKTPVNQLYHYGILGQKWGVRRFQREDGTRTAAGKAQRQEAAKSEDHTQSRSDRQRATQGLSNAELKRLNERLQLEKTYRDLTNDELKKGESFAKSIFKEIAKQSLTDAGKELASGLMKQFVVKPILNSTQEKKK